MKKQIKTTLKIMAMVIVLVAGILIGATDKATAQTEKIKKLKVLELSILITKKVINKK